jgi:hypothetical protein
MSLKSWIKSLLGKSIKGSRRREPVRSRPRLEALEDRTLPSVTPLKLPQWTERGPGPIVDATSAAPDGRVSGAVESVAVSTPQQNGTNHYIVYAGTTNGGIWLTDDITDSTFNYQVVFGTGPFWILNPSANPSRIHWRPLTDNMSSLATSAMALDPTDSSGNTLWVGTGDFGSFGNGGPRKGLLLTRDGGQTWNVMGQATLGNYRIASIVPTGLQNIISTPGGLTFNSRETILEAAYDGGGIWRSTDGGSTFQLAFDKDNATASNPDGTRLSGTATDLVADPNNIHRYFAAMVGAGVAGIYQSIDDGAHWSRIDNSGIPNSVISSAEMIRLAVHADSNGTVLFVGVMDNPPPPPGSPPPPRNSDSSNAGRHL